MKFFATCGFIVTNQIRQEMNILISPSNNRLLATAKYRLQLSLVKKGQK